MNLRDPTSRGDRSPRGRRWVRIPLLQSLGQGGMGAVFRSRDPRPGKPVAIKIILEGKATEQTRAHFRREASALAQLRHPGIAAILDTGEDRGRLYLVLELIDGARPLDDVLPELARKERERPAIARARG